MSEKFPESIEMEPTKGYEGDSPSEIVIEAFKREIIKPGDKLIDIGSGYGKHSNWLAEKGVNVTGINIDQEEIKEAENRAKELGVEVKYVRADARDIPFQENSFDIALDWGCSHALDRDGQKKLEKEAARIVKPGGTYLYFGWNKNHPATIPGKPGYRDMEDIKDIYGEDFEILNNAEIKWDVTPGEMETYKQHIGEVVLMKRKQEME